MHPAVGPASPHMRRSRPPVPSTRLACCTGKHRKVDVVQLERADPYVFGLVLFELSHDSDDDLDKVLG